MVGDYADGGCIWLEIRTTPKAFAKEGASKEDYIRAVCSAARRASAGRDIIVKVLVSVNRADGVADAEEHVRLAAAMRADHGDVIAGVDLSGNFHKGDWEELKPFLQQARDAGLPLAVHFAERQGAEEPLAEQLSMLRLRPERLGHAAHVCPGAASLFAESALPVEVCLTAHVSLRWVDSYREHWARRMAEEETHPVALCCDNTLVFGTSCLREHALAVKHWGLSEDALRRLCRRAAEHCFCRDDGERERLLRRF
eukprot:TRINITY_DN800_c0_g1_i2.p2 TRINITY_DN800_c0_g1~~TRINITY_DN800_c0_g1_i2.p2  ORF type:complete len:255 (+),score=105.19 TRINITY_DN800_c0_g1_i2:257-1021(+)